MKTKAPLLRFALTGVLLNLALMVGAAPPSISFQPQSQTVVLYEPAAFGVIAGGSALLSYQWRKEGAPIAGETNDQIVLPHAQFSDAGVYSVVVSTLEKRVTSADAELTVKPPVGGDLDYSFDTGSTVNGTVLAVVAQPDGKVVIAGSFSAVNGASRGRVARLNPDGTTDHTFMHGLAGADSFVFSMALQNDGKVLIGGIFTNVNGVARSSIARLNPDGSLDSSFNAGATVQSTVHSVVVQPDGKVLVGGSFTQINGVPRNRIARVNADGTLDTSFQDGMSGVHESFVPRILAIAVQSDGKVLIGGGFTDVNAVARTNLARLNADGSLDPSFQDGIGGVSGNISAPVWAVAVQSDGKALIGGGFSSVNGVARNGTARLNADGSLDASFKDAWAGVDGAFVNSFAIQRNGKIIIGGTAKGIARLNADGSLDVAFLNGWSGGNNQVRAVALQHDGKVLVGGDFIAVNQGARSIARLNQDGSLDNGFHNGKGGIGFDVTSLAVQSDGKVLIGEIFWNAGGVTHSGLARLNADGTPDTGFLKGLSGVETTNAAYFYLNAVTVQNDGRILIGGDFTLVNGVVRNRLARLKCTGQPTRTRTSLRWSCNATASFLFAAISRLLTVRTAARLRGSTPTAVWTPAS